MAEGNALSISSDMETYSLGQTSCRCNSDFIQHMNYLKTGHLSTSWRPNHSKDNANHDVLLSASQHLWFVCTLSQVNKEMLKKDYIGQYKGYEWTALTITGGTHSATP